MKLADHYVLVLGGTKSGTSSIFSYLGDHPQITPSLQKQTDFFLDKFEILNSDSEVLKTISQKYKTHFMKANKAENTTYLDVSPDYFCSDIALKNIVDFSSNNACSIYVIVRNPIDRLVSWYHFGQMIGLVPASQMFHEFVKEQNSGSTNPAYSAKSTGRFTQYLKTWNDNLPNTKVQPILLKDLSNNPSLVMKEIADSLAIDKGFYDAYSFHQHNKTQAPKSMLLQTTYVRFQKTVKKLVLQNETVNKLSKPIFALGAKLYRKANTNDLATAQIPNSLQVELQGYYQEELSYLEQLNSVPADNIKIY